jgi:multidrug efflux pump subunit AcrA (membrane-fusion protein)
VPKEDLENKELEHDFAVDELNRLKIVEQREQIEYNTAKRQLAKRNLYAPFSGSIAEVLSAVGQNCEVDTPLLRLVDISKGYFVANVELPISQSMKLGDNVKLRFDAGQEIVDKEGEIFMISPLVDRASGLRKIKVIFENQDHQVVPGMAGQMLLGNTQ